MDACSARVGPVRALYKASTEVYAIDATVLSSSLLKHSLFFLFLSQLLGCWIACSIHLVVRFATPHEACESTLPRLVLLFHSAFSHLSPACESFGTPLMMHATPIQASPRKEGRRILGEKDTNACFSPVHQNKQSVSVGTPSKRALFIPPSPKKLLPSPIFAGQKRTRDQVEETDPNNGPLPVPQDIEESSQPTVKQDAQEVTSKSTICTPPKDNSRQSRMHVANRTSQIVNQRRRRAGSRRYTLTESRTRPTAT